MIYINKEQGLYTWLNLELLKIIKYKQLTFKILTRAFSASYQRKTTPREQAKRKARHL